MNCKGQHFRCDIQQFPGDRGFAVRTRFRLLKSESCPGCDDCAEIIRRIGLLGKGGAYIDNLGVATHGAKFKVVLRKE